MNINIKLTDRQVKFLKQYADVYENERECDITSDPIVVVQTQERLASNPEYYYDGYAYILDHEDSFDSLDDLFEFMDDNGYEYEKETIEATFDNDSEYKDGDIHIAEWCYQITWRNVAFFLTRKEANDYCRYQAHNLIKPRVYTYYMGYANHGDLQCLAPLLLAIGETINKK